MTSVKTLTSPSNSAKSVFQHVKYEHLVAGITGGVASTLILHPLDLIKIRFAGTSLFLIFSDYCTVNASKSCVHLSLSFFFCMDSYNYSTV